MATWERAGAQESTLLVAMTGKDEVNLTVALLGRHQFSIPQIVARVNNPKNAWLFTPDMGGDQALNQTDVLTQPIAVRETP